MNRAPFPIDELRSLADIVCDGEFTENHIARIEQLLRGNVDAQQFYLTHVCFDRQLRWVVADQVEEPTASCSASLPPSFFSTTLHVTLGYFSEGMPLAYLLAAVIVGVGLLIGSRIYVAGPEQVVHQSVPLPSPRSTTHYPLPTTHSIVGRITGMVDCQWANSLPSPACGRGAGGEGALQLQSPVHLHDRFALSSGLLEITYATGAKVILQGPVAYEVESPASGYLSVGKLTARVESRGERREEREEDPDSTLRLPPSALFSVRTPTAVVTDLGTEFGVEVNKEGYTTSHVFRGSVEVRPSDDGGKQQSQTIRLTESESVRVEKPTVAGSDRSFVVRREAVNPERFVRTLPLPKKPLPMQIATHFRFGEDDRGAVAGKPAAEETVNRCRHYHLERLGSPSYTADTAAPGSTLAMSFNAANKDYFANSQWYIAPTDNFVVEAWVRFKKLAHPNEVIVYMGDTERNGYGIMVKDGNWAFLLGGSEDFGGVYDDSGVKCEPGKWTHLALVCERGRARLWIDGRPIGEVHQGSPSTPDPLFMIGGNLRQTEYFDGQIDEVRLSMFRGPFQPEMLMLPAAMRSAQSEKKHQP